MYKKCTKKYDFSQKKFERIARFCDQKSEWAIRSEKTSNLSWGIWANRSQSLIQFERSEQSEQSERSEQSEQSEQMSEFPTLSTTRTCTFQTLQAYSQNKGRQTILALSLGDQIECYKQNLFSLSLFSDLSRGPWISLTWLEYFPTSCPFLFLSSRIQAGWV